MIKIDIKDCEKVEKLYEEVKKVILSNKKKQDYNYNMHRFNLCELDGYPGKKNDYYNEEGSVSFENEDGQTVFVEIERWHQHSHNGFCGLCGIPCLKAKIYIKKDVDKELLWELNVVAGTLHFEASVTSLELPMSALSPKNINEGKNNEKETNDNRIDIARILRRDLFDSLRKAYKSYCDAEEENKKILLQRKNEIEDSKKRIIDSYSEKINNSNLLVRESLSKLNSYDVLVSEYSTFNLDMIGNAITELIKIIECKEFLYKKVEEEFKKRVHGPIDSWDEIVKRKANIIVDEKESHDCYYNSYACGYDRYLSKIEQLAEKGSVIILSQYDFYSDAPNDITFFTSENGNVKCSVKFGKYKYVKDFITELVRYRYDMRLEEINSSDILKCMKEFISKHDYLIVQNSIASANEKVLKLSL